MRKEKIRTIAGGIAFLGFMLMLTEEHGGPWAGTFAGAVLFIAGFLWAMKASG